jgi:SAM-dependent methyltransferase
LATLARLFGLSPAPPQRCRVLEVGCGDGGNLIPIALGSPGAHCIGFDLSAKAIARGREIVREIGLTNIELTQADLMAFRPEAEFDYIIAHGFMSWVPPPVQQRLLELCRDSLAPQGIACISYNTFPGFHLRRMLREMMRYHVAGFPSPRQQIDQSRAFLQFLIAGQTKSEEYSAFLKHEADWILDRDSQAVLYHDDLAEINIPFYFHEFVALARRFDLDYLAEADFFEMQDRIYPEPVIQALQQIDDPIRKEQYLDFLKCRRFRQTLLAHRDLPIRREPDIRTLPEFWVASAAKPKSEVPDLTPGAVEQFEGPRGGAMQIDHAPTKAAMLVLRETWPRPIPFFELLNRARTILGEPVSTDWNDEAQIFAEVLVGIWSAGLVELHSLEPAWAVETLDKPRLSPLARIHLRQGRPQVVTLRPSLMAVEAPFYREFFQLLDGTRDRATLVLEMGKLLDEGKVSLPPEIDRSRLPEVVEGSIRRAARNALLIDERRPSVV